MGELGKLSIVDHNCIRLFIQHILRYRVASAIYMEIVAILFFFGLVSLKKLMEKVYNVHALHSRNQ